MGLFDFLKKKKNNNQDKLKSETRIIAPFKFNVEEKHLYELTERQYEALYDKFDNAAMKFLEIADEAKYEFENEYSYSNRIKYLKSAKVAFYRCIDIVAPYWFQDPFFMELMNIKEYDPWRRVDNESIDYSLLEYDFDSIHCIEWLIEYYMENEDDIRKQLKEEKELAFREEFETQKEYEDYIKYRDGYKKFKKKVLDIIANEPNILQKDIRKHIDDEFWHKYISKLMKELVDNGDIIREKSGNTYKITIKVK